jgi:hypothetical protein
MTKTRDNQRKVLCCVLGEVIQKYFVGKGKERILRREDK